MKVKVLFTVCCLLIMSNLTYAQSKVSSLEKVADSIYFNLDDYSNPTEIKKGILIYNNALNLIRNTNSYRFNTLKAKKYALNAAYFEYENKFDSAIVYSNKSINLQNNSKDQNLYLKGYTYKHLYKQWDRLNNMDSMIVYAKKAEKTFRDTLGDKHKLIAAAIFDLGNAYGRKGQDDKNIEYYKKAIEMNIATNGEYTREAAIQEHHLALTYGFIGFYKKELESYKKVIKRWEAIQDYKDMSYLSVAYGSLSTWYLQHGDIPTAEQYVLKKETLIKTRKNDLKNWFNETFKGRAQLSIWYSYADVALYKKDTVKASLYIDKILDFVANFDENDPRNNPHNLSYFKNFLDLYHMHTLRLKGRVLKNNKPNEANELDEKILKLAGDDGASTVTLPVQLNILDYYIRKKDFSSARKKLERFTMTAKEMKSDYVLMLLSSKNANVLIAENNNHVQMDVLYKDVFKKLQRDTAQSIPIQNLKSDDCKPYGDGRIVSMILDGTKNYSRAYEKTSRNDYLNKAHNLSTMASSIFSENFSYLPYNQDTYETAAQIKEELLNTALLLKDNVTIDEVLESIEQTESKLSWKKFLTNNQRANLNIPDSILERENDLKSELYFYKKALFTKNETNEEKVKLFKEKMYNVETNIERLEEWYRDNYPGYYTQTQKPFNLNELKQQLKKNQRIIKYVVADKQIYAFSVTNETTTLIKLGAKEVLNKKVASFIAGLSNANAQRYKNLAQDLWDHLLPEDLLKNAKKQDLIFIQDDILNFLPMEVLLSPKGKYLIQSYAVSYAPSLLLWNEQLKVKKSRRNKLGIFAPIYKDYFKENPQRNDSTALLGAFSEAMQISEIFKSDVYSGIAASKETFVKKANDYNILHLAMHSTVNNADLEFSNLSFSPDKSDNKLYMSELYNISLNADLAVLSACNTGSGALKKGEGLINVSKAFTYAGVPSLVTSLWSVPDKETAEIMVSFYTYLKEGKSKNEALQKAKLDYLNNTVDEQLKHPYYWAGFVVSGDISPINTTTDYWTYVWIALAIFLLFYFLKKKNVNIFKN